MPRWRRALGDMSGFPMSPTSAAAAEVLMDMSEAAGGGAIGKGAAKLWSIAFFHSVVSL